MTNRRRRRGEWKGRERLSSSNAPPGSSATASSLTSRHSDSELELQCSRWLHCGVCKVCLGRSAGEGKVVKTEEKVDATDAPAAPKK